MMAAMQRYTLSYMINEMKHNLILYNIIECARNNRAVTHPY